MNGTKNVHRNEPADRSARSALLKRVAIAAALLVALVAGLAVVSTGFSFAQADQDPVAHDDFASTPLNTLLDDFDVLANDTDPNGDDLTVTAVDAVGTAGGAVADNGDGTIDFTPVSAVFFGLDTFTYTIEDEDTNTDTGTVYVFVEAAGNAAPVADDDPADTDRNTPVSVDVLDGDTDGDADPLEIVWYDTESTDGGTVALDDMGNGDPTDDELVYTPPTDYSGTDTFTYVIHDGNGGWDMATVTVLVNDPPDAVDDSDSTDEDEDVDIDVLDNDDDPENDDISIVSFTDGTDGIVTLNGNNTLKYTPDPDFNGIDTFTYTIEDEHGQPDTATVTVTVDPVNDPPTAVNDTTSTGVDTPLNVDVMFNDFDVDGDTFEIADFDTTTINGGTIALDNMGTGDPTDDELVYTPDTGFIGSDTFEYTIEDPDGEEDTATVVVTILPANLPPNAVNDSDTTPEDTPVNIDVLFNDTDVETPGALVVSAVGQPANGAVVVELDDTVTYTPDPFFNGIDTFPYTACDPGGLCDTATVTVTVTAVNNDPVARDDIAATFVGVNISINLINNDTDADGTIDPASIVINSGPTAGGTIVTVNNDGTVTYSPPGIAAVDTFTYTVDDNDGATSNVATVVVDVNNTTGNEPPVAVDDTASTPEDTAVIIDVRSNDSDAESPNASLSVLGTTVPGHGGVVSNGNGTVTYTPALNFNGTDYFSYLLCDPSSECDVATVTVTVTPVNDAPVANDDLASTNLNTPVTVNVIQNDLDIDNAIDPTSVEIVTGPSNGAVTVHNVGTVTYTPNTNFTGSDSFTYTVEDVSNALSNVATVQITVSGTLQFIFVPSTSGTIYPNQTRRHFHTLTNISGFSDSYTIELEETAANWDQELIIRNSGGTELATLEAGESTVTPSVAFGDYLVLEHSISAPETVDHGTSQTARITATSVANSSVSAAVTDALTVQAGCISGVVYEDADRDGRYDSTENEIDDVTVRLRLDGDTIQEDTTNSSGAFLFEGLAPDDYTVRVDEDTLPSNNFVWIDPDDGDRNENVDPGTSCETSNFGLIFVDASIAMAGPTTSLVWGTSTTFTITVKNLSDGDMTDVSVVHPLGDHMTFTTATTTSGIFVHDAGSNTLTFEIGTLAAGATATLKDTVLIKSGAPNVFVTTATLRFDEGDDESASVSVTTLPTTSSTTTTAGSSTSSSTTSPPASEPTDSARTSDEEEAVILPETGIRPSAVDDPIQLGGWLTAAAIGFLLGLALLLVSALRTWPRGWLRVAISLLSLSASGLLAGVWLAQSHRPDLLAVILFDSLANVLMLAALVGLLAGAALTLRSALRGEYGWQMLRGLALSVVCVGGLGAAWLLPRPVTGPAANLPLAPAASEVAEQPGRLPMWVWRVLGDQERIAAMTGSGSEIIELAPTAVPSVAATRLLIPQIAVDAPLVEAHMDGFTWNVFSLGADIGHLEGTGVPGGYGNAVLAGHIRNLDGYGPFANLDHLQPGDVIYAQGDGVRYVYEVTGAEEVDARAMEVAETSFGRKLTLVTCANWDREARTYTHRYVVTAQFVRAETTSS